MAGRQLPALRFRQLRVARRVFLLCALCALLPMLVIGVLVYTRVAAEVTADAHADLQDLAKRYGLLLHDRLEQAEADLIEAGSRHLSGRSLPMDAVRAPRIAAISVSPLQTVPLETRRRYRQVAELAVGEETLRLVEAGDGYAVQLGARIVDPRGRAVTLSAIVSPDYLWDTDVVEQPGAQLCVRAGPMPLNCSGEEPGGKVVRESWNLFLLPRFGAADWTVSATQPRHVARAGLAGMRRDLPLYAAAALLIALLIGSLEVRRAHGPLSGLLRAFRAMRRGRFVKVGLTAGRDEYSRLGRAFNQLSRTLRRQFRLLATLERMDQAILHRPAVGELVLSMLPRLPAVLDCDCVGIAAAIGPGRFLFSWMDRRGGRQVESRQLGALDEAIALLQSLHAGLRWEQTPLRVGGVERGLLICGRRNAARIPRAVRHQAKGVARRFAVALRNEERERQLLRQAREDELTQLPNRRWLQDCVQRAVGEAASTGETLAFVYLDLDRFKTLNDSLGHRFGDELLARVAARLASCANSSDTVARIGGDEFALLLRDVTAAGARSRLEGVLARLHEPVLVRDLSIQPCASTGIAMYPADGSDFDTLLRNADVAMYAGKVAGGGRIVFFEEQMNRQAQRRLLVESGLRQALKAGHLQLHFQPKVVLSDGSLHGMEALLRWEDPVLGRVGPDEFIPVAEESGLIQELGRFALERAVEFCRRCLDESVPVGHVAVNVSMLQLCDAQLVDFVGRLLVERRVPPSLLQVEITESSIVRDVAMAQEVLGRLRALGVRVAIDDFGTGYSSLAVLQTLPVDLLKIDRSFVARMAASTESLELVRAMLGVCRALGLPSIAEGVETASQHELLAANGCDYAQGFLYSRPVAAPAALELIRGWPLRARPAPWIMRA